MPPTDACLEVDFKCHLPMNCVSSSARMTAIRQTGDLRSRSAGSVKQPSQAMAAVRLDAHARPRSCSPSGDSTIRRRCTVQLSLDGAASRSLSLGPGNVTTRPQTAAPRLMGCSAERHCHDARSGRAASPTNLHTEIRIRPHPKLACSSNTPPAQPAASSASQTRATDVRAGLPILPYAHGSQAAPAKPDGRSTGSWWPQAARVTIRPGPACR